MSTQADKLIEKLREIVNAAETKAAELTTEADEADNRGQYNYSARAFEERDELYKEAFEGIADVLRDAGPTPQDAADKGGNDSGEAG